MTAATDSLRDRELDVAREVANAFLTASTPVEVYRLALARVTPLVRASFSSVFERDPADPELLRLTCANSWPQSSARWLGELRLRVGRGPTGRAVAELRPVEVRDVFADPLLSEWHEPARELGFVSLISLPLVTGAEASGALTFYFDEPHEFDEAERHLLKLVADQLALAGGRIESLEASRREVEELRGENDLLRRRVGAGEDAKRLTDEFLANISHELRTPLTSILGYATLLIDGQTGAMADAQRNTVLRIERSARVLLALINDLLELSEIRVGRAELNNAPDDAVRLARRALDEAGAMPPAVRVTLDADPDRIPLMVDGEKVVKILENLLSNAYKFTERGTVTLSVRTARDDGVPVAEWIVSDTGIGIPADGQEAIFDAFRQMDGSSTRLHGGTGLGLTLCRALSRMLGGTLTVRSEPGRGAQFRLVVPGVV
jgi:signal transduction histidine kinase